MSEDAQEISETSVLKKLRAFISYECGISDLAKRFGVSRSVMSNVLKGEAEMTDAMLKAVGVRRITVFMLDAKAA